MANALKGASLPGSGFRYRNETLKVIPAKIPVLAQVSYMAGLLLSIEASILAFDDESQVCLLLFVIMPRKKSKSPEDMPALQILRDAVGLTQAQLASRIPDKTRKKTLSRQVISGWERGEYEPELTIPQIKALCHALGKTLDELPDDFGKPTQLTKPEN